MKVTNGKRTGGGALGYRQGVVAVVVICFLAFVLGAAVGDFHVFPYRAVFEGPFSYIHAKATRRANEKSARKERAGAPAQGTVTVSQPGALQGYTFLTFDEGRPSTARLVDMTGKVVHEWRRDFSRIWPKPPPHNPNPASDGAITWRYGKLFPNGDIIVSVISDADTPAGYGLVKFDKDSNVIWKVEENVHHEFTFGQDGRIYALAHEWRDLGQRPVKGLERAVESGIIPRRVLEDFVLEISPDGKLLSKTSILEVMASSGYAPWITSSMFGVGWAHPWDRMHPNDVEIIDPAFAGKHPALAKAGEVLVSLRDLDTLMVMDLKDKSVTWAMRGPWMRQHDPDLLENGDLILFDNRGRMGPTGKSAGSRALEFDPESGKVVWDWNGTDAEPMRSDYSGGVQALPNGDVLISEDDAGRVREVAKDGTVVWEYKDVRLHHAWRVEKGFVNFELNGGKLAGG